MNINSRSHFTGATFETAQKPIRYSVNIALILKPINHCIRSLGPGSVHTPSSIEHGGTSTVFYMMEQFDNMGVRAQFSIWWINILVTLWRYPQRGSQTKKCCFIGPLECKFWSNLIEPLNGKRLSEAREHIFANE